MVLSQQVSDMYVCAMRTHQRLKKLYMVVIQQVRASKRVGE